MSLSRHPACPRQGPAVPVPAPFRICLTLHHASRKLVVLATELFQFVVFRSGYVAGSIRGWIEKERSRKLYAYVFMRIGVACTCVCVYVCMCVCVCVLRRGAPATVAFWCHAQRERERSGAHTILRRGKRQLLDAMVLRWLWRLIDVKCNNFALLMSPGV